MKTTDLLYIPLTNRVRVPYFKLRTEFFPHRFMSFMAQAQSVRAINRRGKTYITDRENEVSKIFITSLLCV